MRKINTRSFRLATRATPREVNRQIVLNLIREFQPISRAELARRMNVRRAALTAIVRDLKLRRPIYTKTAAYGHFGRDVPEFTWEHTDKADALRAAAGLGEPA